MDGIWDPGGIGGYIRRIAAAQRADGHEVFALDSRPGSLPDPETGERPRIVRDDADLFIAARGLRLDILHLHTTVSALPADRVPTLRTLHGHSPYCPSGSRYLSWSGQPCDRAYSPTGCLWGHLTDHCGSIRPRKMLEEFRRTWTERRILPQLLTITASEFLKEQMTRNGYPVDRIEALRIPSPDIEPTRPPIDGPPRFVFLGRIEVNKGVGWLLRAAATAASRPLIDVVGDGTQLDKMRSLTSQLGITDRVSFHGWIPGSAALDVLRASRALVLPSVWHEPGATVAVEAMSAGRPLIMSRVGGMIELISDGRNGILVRPNDVAGLAAALDRLATDYDSAARMGEEGRRLVEAKFSLDAHLGRLMSLYERGARLS